MDTSLLPAAVIAAALVIRTALHEIRIPGSARQEWGFLNQRKAVLSGAVTALCLVVMGWSYAGHGTLAWAGLVGVLVAYLVGRQGPGA
ncbi:MULTISPECIES: hypothetical protein [Streptomyces]|uniref:hypothetical protein n=1 Tax=Streptomyces TaxID=1883 RepID=UPI001E3DCEA2|nr:MULTISPECIES: hypothetical protein [Streptomyces]UFQ18913.1 hypothetical protein J2N69_30230 [Streptomyces huasconensis]WCL88532.1 hypothetical protein PPN52_30195 [Streptomyces sp. JCM 35825]